MTQPIQGNGIGAAAVELPEPDGYIMDSLPDGRLEYRRGALELADALAFSTRPAYEVETVRALLCAVQQAEEVDSVVEEAMLFAEGLALATADARQVAIEQGAGAALVEAEKRVEAADAALQAFLRGRMGGGVPQKDWGGAPAAPQPPKLSPDRENLIRLGAGMYIVRTQAGFRRALKNFDPERAPRDVRGWPTSYPAFVALSDGYEGYHFTRARCIPVSVLQEAIAAQGDARMVPLDDVIARLEQGFGKGCAAATTLLHHFAANGGAQ